MPEVPLIHTAMFNVQEALPKIEKLGELKLGSNTAKTLRIDDILEALVPLLVQQKIIVVPKLIHRESREDLGGDEELLGPDANKQIVKTPRVPSIRVREVVTYEFEFVCITDGSSITTTVSAEAMDVQDKASRKAATSAQKTAYILAFNIRTGEQDPDESSVPDVVDAKPSRGQQMTRTARGAGSQPKAAAPEPASEAAPEEPKPSISTDPRPKPETVFEASPPEIGELDALKGRVRDAVTALGGSAVFTKLDVDTLAANAIGKADAVRADWINSTPAMKKVVSALEAKVAEKATE